MKSRSNALPNSRRSHAPRAWRGLALATLACAAPAAFAGDGDGAPKGAAPSAATRDVDLAICLDTSGSMDGLIDAARQKIWSIVNDLALARPAPKLHVALLTYGNDGHPAEVGWVRIDSPFTEDLDRISQQLFALKTNGGTELVGRVLQTAAGLQWSPDPQALKLVVVAGNESAEQDPKVNFRDVCKQLVEHGILVNSIYCGNPMDDLAPAWREVAQKADGQFAAIDQQNGTVTIATPFDAELATLSVAINETYVWYGKAGVEACENQKAQDSNAAGANGATAACRALTKGSCAYVARNDLVDAVKTGQLKLADVKKEELPEKMKEMTIEQKQKWLDDAGARRAEIAKKIQAIGQKRDGFLTEELARQQKDDNHSFDRAVRDAVRRQAEAKGFKFEKVKDA
jgi:Mg-chelatase subunit ChlD/Skp family chaperone for outer membrane proteins